MPRSRGALSGLLIVLMGIWGALIPFVGPYFDFTIGSQDAWDWSSERLLLHILPGAAAVLGGLMLLGATRRGSGRLGALLALAGGIWFVIGPTMSMLWNDGVSLAGPAAGSTGRRTLEWMTYHPGLGAAITALAALALGRFGATIVRRDDDDVAHARRAERDRRFFRRRHREAEPEPVGAGRPTTAEHPVDR